MTGGLAAHLLDASLRSLIVALLAAAFCAVRFRRNAAAGHSVWTAALAGMLMLLTLAPLLPVLPLRVLAPASAAIAAPSPAWRQIAAIVYAVVTLVFLSRMLLGSRIIRKLLRAGTPVRLPVPGNPPAYESDAISVPLVAGWLRPKVLLPSGWRAWEPAKLEAVLAHEAAHLRRRDPLVAWAAALNRSLFWFHPLAWWLERKLALLAEQACDEACLALAPDRERYAGFLLEMAAEVEARHGRIYWRLPAMAQPRHIRRRIDRILEGGRTPSPAFTRRGWIAVLCGALPLLYATAAVRLLPQPPLLTIDVHAAVPAAPSPVAGEPVPELHLSAARRSERALLAAVESQADPRRRLAMLDAWRQQYPHSPLERTRLQLYLNTYSQLNDVPNLLAALNQMGKTEFLQSLRINPSQAELDFSPVNVAADGRTPGQVSHALFYFARAAAYDGPGSLAPQSRQQVDEYLRKAYSTYYGPNDVGLNELKNLAKSYPFPPQYFNIAPLPPPSRTFDAALAAETSSVRIRNKCPYGIRIDCNGPERKRTWIPSGEDTQLVVTPGAYQIYAADLRGVSSFTGPGRFDPQFDYEYELSAISARRSAR